jgi:hypothetical protein
MINNYIRTAMINSKYLTPEEKNYLTEKIEYGSLFFRNNKLHSMTAILKKKNS